MSSSKRRSSLKKTTLAAALASALYTTPLGSAAVRQVETRLLPFRNVKNRTSLGNGRFVSKAHVLNVENIEGHQQKNKLRHLSKLPGTLLRDNPRLTRELDPYGIEPGSHLVQIIGPGLPHPSSTWYRSIKTGEKPNQKLSLGSYIDHKP